MGRVLKYGLLTVLVCFALYGAWRLREDIIVRRAKATIVTLNERQERLTLQVPMSLDQTHIRVDSIQLVTYFGCNCQLEERTMRETALHIVGQYDAATPRLVCTTVRDTTYSIP